MSEQMDATKDSTGESSSPNTIQSVAEFVRKNIEPFKKPTWFWGWTIQNLLITSFKIL